MENGIAEKLSAAAHGQVEKPCWRLIACGRSGCASELGVESTLQPRPHPEAVHLAGRRAPLPGDL